MSLRRSAERAAASPGRRPARDWSPRRRASAAARRPCRSRWRARRTLPARRRRSTRWPPSPSPARESPQLTTSAPQAAWARTSVSISSGWGTSSPSRKTTQGALPASRPAWRSGVHRAPLAAHEQRLAGQIAGNVGPFRGGDRDSQLAVGLGGQRRQAAHERLRRLAMHDDHVHGRPLAAAAGPAEAALRPPLPTAGARRRRRTLDAPARSVSAPASARRKACSTPSAVGSKRTRERSSGATSSGIPPTLLARKGMPCSRHS